jgi:O-Antigen ligase
MEAFLVARILFWCLGIGIIALPLRWALVCYLLIMHIDLSGPSFASASSLGLENVLKIVGLPILLLLRMKMRPLSKARITWPIIIWLAFILYATLTTFWSAFPFAGMKMVSYLFTYLLLFIIFTYAWSEGLLDQSSVAISLWLILGIAILQTYVLGNPFGYIKIARNIIEFRFTSFSSPQSFAGYLIATISILIFSKKLTLFSYISIFAALCAILVTGSRYVLFGTILLFLFSWTVFMLRKSKGQNQRLKIIKGILIPVVLIIELAFVAYLTPNNRLNQLISSDPNGGATVGSVGTFIWRLGIYERAFQMIPERDLPLLIFGSGTSSGAEIVLGYDPRYSEEGIDANRVVHNDFIRSLYEWGMIGSFLFIYFLMSVFIYYLELATIKKSIAALAFIGIFPNLIFGLSIENILTASGSPEGVGIVLVLAYSAIRRRDKELVAIPLQERDTLKILMRSTQRI